MRKFLMLSMVLTLVSSCCHMGGHGKHGPQGPASCSDCKDSKCKAGESCPREGKPGDKKEECDDCKKGTKS